MKKLMNLSLLSFISILLVFTMVSFAWFTMDDTNSARTGFGVTDMTNDNYIIEITGINTDVADLNILPGEVKEYLLTTENLNDAILSINCQKNINNAYIIATNSSLNYFDINLSGYYVTGTAVTNFYNSSNVLITGNYNLYQGLYNEDSSPISSITNGTNTINLYYHNSEKYYNTNEYYTSDDLRYNYSKQDIFEGMINNSSITGAIKYYFSTTINPIVDWSIQPYVNNPSTYTITQDSIYLYLYFDPNVYTTYNDITLRNSNAFLFQSLGIVFNVTGINNIE